MWPKRHSMASCASSDLTSGCSVCRVTPMIAARSGPGAFVKPMFMNYRGEGTAKIPTAAGSVADLEATANAFTLVGGYT